MKYFPFRRIFDPNVSIAEVKETLENLKVGPHRILTPLSQ